MRKNSVWPLAQAMEYGICPAGMSNCKAACCMAWREVERGKTGYCGLGGQPIELAAELAAAQIFKAVNEKAGG